MAAIGLEEVMTERNFIDPYDKSLFHRYTPEEYLHSPHRDMDEIYRMSEVVLQHIPTGLRVTYLTTESYDGDELRYRAKDVFIITHTGQHLNVTAANFTKEVFNTPSGTVPFKEVNKE